MQYHPSNRNIVWIVLLLFCTILSFNGCSDANNVTGPPPPVPLSPDAKLSRLTVTSGSLQPGFSSDTANYSVEVATSVTSVTVTAQAQNAGATITIHGQTATSQSVPLGEPGSSTPIPIVVTAVSGSQNTYIVTVNRTALGGNNNLQSLTVAPGSLAPPFTASTLPYTVNVASGVGSVTVTAQPQDGGATVSINGQPTTNPSSVPLGAEGSSTVILIVVMAPNGNQKTYAVTVIRAASVPLSGNNNLSGLVVSAGPLDPPFDGTTNYNVQTSILTPNTTVTATVADLTATLTINDSPATSGVASASIPLTPLVGNPISIVVTAENGTPKSYTVTVTPILP